MKIRIFASAILFMLSAAGWSLPATAESLCGKPPRPTVEVGIADAKVTFDTKKSMEELAQINIDTTSPWPQTYHTVVGGIMQGKISAYHKITFSRLPGERIGTGCVWFDKIQITLALEPKIYIARNLRDKACLFREIFAHEAKHVEEDRALLEKFRTQIADGLNMAFMEPADYVSKDVPNSALDAAQKELEDSVAKTLAIMFEMLMRERAQRQQALDSLGEYMRVSSRC